MEWQAVFFDFDGVILDSVDVKTKAFAKMFHQYGPEIESKVVSYHLENGGVSRFDKFRYYYKEYLKQDLSEEKLMELSNQFSALVVQEVVNSDFIEGAFETLNELKRNEIPAYIVSGTPHDEIKDIVRQKGLALYFDEIHGSPKKKEEITKDILQRKNYDSKKCLFIGDALSDYEAAVENEMHFLGIVPKNEQSIFPKNSKISFFVSLR
jgi:HAD superfamily hydrolase (TIGR01549 family)